MLRRAAPAVLFLLRRLRLGVLVVVGVSVLIFSLARVMPGDPARLALGPAASADQVAAMRVQLGLDRPLLVQYGIFVAHALRFDFGVSLYTSHPVAEDIAETFPATFELVLVAGVIMGIAGIGVGIASARFKDGSIDNGSRLLSLLCVAMPNFVWALIMMLVASYWLGVLPIDGRLSDDIRPPPEVTGLLTVDSLIAGRYDAFTDALRHLILPSIALSLPGLAQLARLTRTNMVDSYARPYVEFARAYGVSERMIALKYALRPASIPLLTLLGMQVVALLGSAFLIEAVFNWPGMARYGVQAMLRKDLNAIVAVATLMSVMFVAFNIIVDGLVAVIDPKIRIQGRL
jgi:peptide/nickel transport system permease protein